MKYGRLLYGKNKLNKYCQYANLGDCIQTFAIDNLYEKSGISKDDVLSVKREYLNETKEITYLPLQGYFTSIKGMTDIYPLPDNFIPLFIGYHDIFEERTVSEEKIKYLKSHAPIGCRDEKTYNELIKRNIPAYISGCLTITLPQRQAMNSQKKVFLVDAPKGIEDYIPDNMKQNIEYVTHEIPFDSTLSYNDNSLYVEEYTHNLLNRYINEASLVVTSRLHCAAPCLGMGIPVILARNYFDDRYSWIDRYLTLYTPDLFDTIDWNVKPVDISKEKQLLTDLFCNLIQNKPIEEISTTISDLYLNRERGNIHTPFIPKVYMKMRSFNPILADIIREKILQPFSVASARKKM